VLSESIERRALTIDGDFFRLECLRRNHYHEIVFEAPHKGDSEFDDLFLDVLDSFIRLLRQCDIGIKLK